MRTKTLGLLALGSFSALGVMAQTNVYSLNAVGYINVTVPIGYSIIADQLWFDSSGSNTFGNILPDLDGSKDFDAFLKFNGTGYTQIVPDSFQTSGYDGTGASATLNPGEACFVLNGGTNVQTFTFVGTVPQGTNVVQISKGYNLISSPVPQAGGVTSVLGLDTDISAGTHEFDALLIYNPGSGYTQYLPSELNITPQDPTGWAPSEPSLNVGQGFFYLVGTQGTAFQWSRVFSVNQ